MWQKAIEEKEDDNGHTEDHGNDFDNDPWHEQAWLFLERNQFISDESEIYNDLQNRIYNVDSIFISGDITKS